MNLSCRNLNAETRRRRGAEVIDESLVENQISAAIIDAAIEVHRVLGGPGRFR